MAYVLNKLNSHSFCNIIKQLFVSGKLRSLTVHSPASCWPEVATLCKCLADLWKYYWINRECEKTLSTFNDEVLERFFSFRVENQYFAILSKCVPFFHNVATHNIGMWFDLFQFVWTQWHAFFRDSKASIGSGPLACHKIWPFTAHKNWHQLFFFMQISCQNLFSIFQLQNVYNNNNNISTPELKI